MLPHLWKGLCNSDIKTRRKLAFGAPLLLLIIAGSFYCASLSTSPAYELLNTVFLIAIALGIILLTCAIKLDRFIYEPHRHWVLHPDPYMRSLCLLRDKGQLSCKRLASSSPVFTLASRSLWHLNLL